MTNALLVGGTNASAPLLEMFAVRCVGNGPEKACLALKRCLNTNSGAALRANCRMPTNFITGVQFPEELQLLGVRPRAGARLSSP